MASLFGEQSGDEIDKFERVQWSAGPGGVPILAECAAWVVGRVVDRMSAGDHEAFLINVGDGGAGRHEGQFMWRDAGGFEPGHPE
jgi:flavin reductase (DIM6/NTAB) family NADH-FMN oxidoreductase RutF